MPTIKPYETPGYAANLLAEATVGAIMIAIYFAGRPWTGLVEFSERGLGHQTVLVFALIGILAVVHPPLIHAWEGLIRRRMPRLAGRRR